MFDASPNPYVLLDPTLAIVDMNAAYLNVTMRTRQDILGRNIFDAFPSDAEAEAQLRASFDRTLRTRERDHIPLIKYDIKTAGGEGPFERYWSATHTPLLDENGEVRFILQHTVDITELHHLRWQASTAETTFSSQVEGAVFQHARAVEDRSRLVTAERDQLRQLFEQAPGFMAVLQGPEHVFVLANAAYISLVGQRDVLGKPLVEALPEVEQQGFSKLLDSIYRSGQTYVGRGVEVVLRSSPDGPDRKRVVDFVYQPIRGADGEIVGIFVQGHDLTEKAEAERALLESERRFRLVSESAPVMLWMSDERGDCVYLNQALRKFWGVDAADVASFDWRSMVHPDDLGIVLSRREESLDRPLSGYTVEARFRRADGCYRLLRATAHPRLDPSGEFAGMIGVNVDVTETRRAEAAVREETRSLEVLNQTSLNVAAELDLERVVQKVTDAGVELTAASYGAFFNTVSDADGEGYRLFALSGVERGTFSGMPRATPLFEPTFRGEAIIRRDDVTADPLFGHNPPCFGLPEGHPPVRSYMAVPVRSRSGKVLGGLFFGHPEAGVFTERSERLAEGLAAQAAVAIDNAQLFQSAEREIAQRKEAELALQQLNARLGQEVAARTEELRANEEALRHAQKMEALGRLTGGIAHDFNNLLQVISGNLQLLSKDLPDSPRAAERLENALSGVTKGATLASQLLAFGRRQPLAPKVIDLRRLVRGIETLLGRAIGEDIALRTELPEASANAFVDPAQVENALLNLAINARDAMEIDGQLAVRLGLVEMGEEAAALREIAPGSYVTIAVSDNGCGMPPDVIEQAFDPFFTTKPEGQGTGLGLSQVYGFVRQSSGTVEIDSVVGEGTTVWIYLPRVDREEDEVTTCEPGLAAGGDETILVVEDDEKVRLTVVEMLRELGYRVHEATDAQSAVPILDEAAFDLLFTDVVMPGPMHSTELAHLARQRDPAIGVLFTSGYTRNALDSDGHLDPGVDLLSKPYTRDQLARRVREVLDRRQALRLATAPETAPSGPSVAGGPSGGEPGRGDEAPDGRSLAILVVEDDALISLSTIDMLDELGHRPVDVATGAAALEVLDGGGVDVLLTDVGLPDMTGIELAEEACRRLPHLRVIFASGHDIKPEDVEGMCARVGILRKPYDEDLLSRVLAEVTGPVDA